MKKQLVLLSVGLMALSGCNRQETAQYKILSPSGAPAVALYNHADILETNSTPKNVEAQLLETNYGLIAYDFYNGLKTIKANNKDYKLSRILTAGNLVLVGINKTTKPQEGDYIVSFGQGNLPDLAFQELYGNINPVVDYVGGVQQVAPVMISGKYQNKDVDYVVMAEPLLTATLATDGLDTTKYHKFSIREDWVTLKGEGSIIPQAGLFIHMPTYNNEKEKYDKLLTSIDEEIKNGVNNQGIIKSTMEQVGDVDAQKSLYGVPAAMAFKVTQNGNGIGLVTDSSNTKEIVNKFLADIKVDENYDDYIL